MAVSVLDAITVSNGSRPASFSISAGSNRRAFLMCMTGSGTDADPVSSAQLGDQTMTEVATENTAGGDVACSMWELTEAQIAAMTGNSFTISGESDTTRTLYAYLSLQDAEQGTLTGTPDFVNGTSNTTSLVRVADSVTLLIQGHDVGSAYNSSSNPTHSSETVSSYHAAYAAVTDTDRTENYSWDHTFSRNDSLILLNVGPAAAGATVAKNLMMLGVGI